jgi:phage-related holin
MEILSVCENLNQAGLPVPTWIVKRLGKAAKDMTENDPMDDKPE